MTQVQDGGVVVVRSLVQTQVVLQRVFQLTEKENENKIKMGCLECVGMLTADRSDYQATL